MSRDVRDERNPNPRLRWLLVTTPPALLASFAYATFEWLFFATKPSMVSVLPWREQLLVLLQTPLPFVLPLFAIQLAFSLLALAGFPRFRMIAAVPAAAVLAALLLVLADNFLYVIVRASIVTSATPGRVLFAIVLAAGFLFWYRRLSIELPQLASNRRSGRALWLPSVLLLAVREPRFLLAPASPDASAFQKTRARAPPKT